MVDFTTQILAFGSDGSAKADNGDFVVEDCVNDIRWKKQSQFLRRQSWKWKPVFSKSFSFVVCQAIVGFELYLRHLNLSLHHSSGKMAKLRQKKILEKITVCKKIYDNIINNLLIGFASPSFLYSFICTFWLTTAKKTVIFWQKFSIIYLMFANFWYSRVFSTSQLFFFAKATSYNQFMFEDL